MRDECLNLIGDGAFVKEKQKAQDVCNWHEQDSESVYWSSDCGLDFVLSDGTPKENGLNFCCRCGKKIVEHEWKDAYENIGLPRMLNGVMQ
jgi:hypothetical protein